MEYVVRLTYPPNRPPRIDGILPSISTSKTFELDLTEYMFDPDDGLMNLTWTYEGGDESIYKANIKGNVLVIIPKEGKNGNSQITLVLEDVSGASDKQVVSVEIVSEKPQVTGWYIVILVVLIVGTTTFLYLMRLRRDRLRIG
jgi:hypothetical protein